MLRLSEYEKGKLYPEILKYIKEKTEFYTIDEFCKLVFRKSTILDLLDRAYILKNEPKIEQVLNRLVIIFIAYNSEDFEDLISQIQQHSKESRSKIVKSVDKLIDEFYNATRVNLYNFWSEKTSMSESEGDEDQELNWETEDDERDDDYSLEKILEEFLNIDINKKEIMKDSEFEEEETLFKKEAGDLNKKNAAFPLITIDFKNKVKKSRGRSINYEICLVVGNSRDYINFAMTREQFNEAIKKGREKGKFPSKIKFTWICLRDEEHGKFPALYGDIKGTLKKKGTGCPRCKAVDSSIKFEDCVTLGNSRDSIDFAMTKEQFNDAIKKGREKRIPPSQVKFTWTCLKDEEHGKFPARYSSVKGTRKKKGSGCSKCSIQDSSIKFEDCIDLGNSRDDIDFAMTKEQFNDAIKEGREKGIFPSYVKFMWTCLRDEEHGNFLARYKDVKGTRKKKGSGCSKCRIQDLSIKFEDCIDLGNSRDDIDFAMTKEQFNDVIKKGRERGIGPNKVKLLWTCLRDEEHEEFPAAYNDVKGTPNRKGTGCPRCYEIQFEDCIVLRNSRDDIDFVMTREQFNVAIKKGKEKGIGPNKAKLTWTCLRDEEHGEFPASYSNVKGTPNKKGTGCPICSDIFNILCIYVHTSIKYIVSSFFYSIGIKIYSEILVSRIFEDFRWNDCIIDSFLLNINSNYYLKNRILNSTKLLNELHLEGKNLSNIKGFLFDYTADVSDENIKAKLRKYQKKDMFLFIVGTKWKKSKKDRVIDTIYKNVRVIRYDLFIELIGFEGIFLNKVKQIFEIFDKNNLEDLYNFKEKLHSEYFKTSGRDLFRKKKLEIVLKSLGIDYYSFFGIE